MEYSHSAGFESYRKGLASYYQSLDIDVSYNDLMVTTGGSEALLFALNSCLDSLCNHQGPGPGWGPVRVGARSGLGPIRALMGP